MPYQRAISGLSYDGRNFMFRVNRSEMLQYHLEWCTHVTMRPEPLLDRFPIRGVVHVPERIHVGESQRPRMSRFVRCGSFAQHHSGSDPSAFG